MFKLFTSTFSQRNTYSPSANLLLGSKYLKYHGLTISCLQKTPKQRQNAKWKSYKWPTWRTITLFYNTFITVLYMLRATSCSSSGGQIVLIQHLVESLSVSSRPVCIPDGHWHRLTIPDAVLVQFDLLMKSTTLVVEDCNKRIIK